MNDDRKYDWFGFWVHFSCGIIAGALAGLYIFSQTGYAQSVSWLPLILFTAGGMVVGSLVAGIFRDGFWEQFFGLWGGWW